MESTVITYGGGEVLQGIFNSIAMLMNGQTGSLFRPLMIIGGSVGALAAIISLIFSPSMQSFMLGFFLPLFALSAFFMLPSQTVRIEDIVTNRSYVVDHVPILLSNIASVSTRIGYAITRALESIMHTSNPKYDSTNYHETGMVFGSAASMDIKKYRITNAILDTNIKRFAKKCMLYDMALGKYSVDDCKKSIDLYAFFLQNTSKVRMMDYASMTDPADTKLVTCYDAIKSMGEYLDKDIDYYNHDSKGDKNKFLGELPLTFKALTGLQKDSKDLIRQMLMMGSIRDGFDNTTFTTNRASTQTTGTYHVLGAMAGSHLLSLRGVFEALLYASFIFIMPLSVMPGGLSILGNWVQMLIWVQMWPPFYAILNYIMQIHAQEASGGIFFGLPESQKGLSPSLPL